MTPAERLAAIAARADAATKPPWLIEPNDDEGAAVYCDDDGFGTAYIARELWQGESEGDDDAAFIAAARQDVPDLVAFAQAVLAIRDEADNDDTAHILDDVRRLADEHLGGA